MKAKAAPREGGSADRPSGHDQADPTPAARTEAGPTADPTGFFAALGLDDLDPDLRVALTAHERDGERLRLHRVRHCGAADFGPDGAAAAFAATETDRGREVYVETSAVDVATAERLDRTGKRGTVDDRAAAVAVAVDVDTTDRDVALAALRSLPLHPTAVVATGTPGHVQALYALGPVLRLDTEAERNGAGRAAILRRRERTARALAAALDVALPAGALDGAKHLDAVHDLTRMVRIPGTVNTKCPDEIRPVELIEADRDRAYTVGLVCDLLDDAAVAAADAGMRGRRTAVETVDVGGMILGRTDELDVDTIRQNAPDLAAVVEAAQRPDGSIVTADGRRYDSASERDMAAVGIAARAECDDQWLADLLATCRAHCLPAKQAKATRADYVASTIVEARSGNRRSIERRRRRAKSREDKHQEAAEREEDLTERRRERAVAAQIPPEIYEERDVLRRVRAAAHHRGRPPDPVLLVVLARVAAITPPTFELPAIVGSPMPLTLLVVIVSDSGIGKTGTVSIGRELLPIPDARIDNVVDGVPIGSGEGVVESYHDVRQVTTKDSQGRERTKKERIRAYDGIVTYLDEGESLAALGSRQGATLLPTLRTMFSGGLIGQANASRERRRIVEAGSYAAGFVVGIQSERAGPLLADVGGGTPQRFVWAHATDPTIPAPEDRPRRWPGGIDWAPPDPPMRGGRTALAVDDTIVAEIQAADHDRATGAVRPDPLDSHAGLVRLKLAGCLALLDHENRDGNTRLHITRDDWRIAGAIQTASDAARDDARRAVDEVTRQQEEAAVRRHAGRQAAGAVASEEAVAMRTTIEAATWIARTVRDPERAPADAWTRATLRRKMTRRLRERWDEAIAHASAERWIVERDEPGQGQARKIVEPGPKVPR